MTDPLETPDTSGAPLRFPDPALFDRRATRGAVLRGLFRTAGLVLALYLAFSFVGSLVGYAAFKYHDRSNAFERVGVVGFAVAHPGIDTRSQRSGTTSWGWLHTTKSDRYLQPDGTNVQTRVRMDTAGRISVDGELTDQLDRALADGRATAAQARAFVDGLPGSAVSDVIVDLTTPLTEQRFADLSLGALKIDNPFFQVRFYDDPYAGARRRLRVQDSKSTFDLTAPDRPVAWSDGTVGYQTFGAWTRALRSSDDANLGRLGLPSSRALKELGRLSLVHGVLLRNVSPAQLKTILTNPAVRTITPVTVRFTILNRDRS